MCLYSLEGSVEESEEITEAANTEVSIYVIHNSFFSFIQNENSREFFEK
jgi:hypothetical protein